jgi:hypothetical protein
MLLANQWYHIAGVYDGSYVRLYVNGVQVKSVAYTSSAKSSTAWLAIGSTDYEMEWFAGDIDQVRISAAARTSFTYGTVSVNPSSAAGEQLGQQTIGASDLAVQSLSPILNADGTLTVQALIANLGSFPTYNEFLIHLYNRLPTGPNDLNGSVGFWVNAPIQAGGTLTLTKVLTDTSGLLLQARKLRSTTETSGTLYGQVDSTGVVSDTNRANNISAGAAFCTATADPFEPDNTAASAKAITLGTPTSHNFHVAGDQDWTKFSAQHDVAYRIITSNLGANADTYVYVYGTDGTTLLGSNDDYGGSLASEIDWIAASTGTYYVMVKHWNPNALACGTTYDLKVSPAAPTNTNPNYLPFIRK